MNFNRRKVNIFATTIYLLVVCSSLLSACGGGSDGSDTVAGIGGTGIVAGKITGFGSVHVNGGKFEIDSSLFNVDGDTGADQGDLALGMVIVLKVETENGVYTGKALEVFYDDEIEGPVDAKPVDVPGSGSSQKTFDIFGQTITIDETGTIFEDTSFTDVDALDVLEVSGFRLSPTEITATFVKWKGVLDPGTTEVELRGTISQFSAVNENFMLDGVLISFDMSTDIELQGGGLRDDLFVEVDGIYFDNPSVFVYAEEIEEEEEGFGDDVEDVSLQGVISNYVSIGAFEINGQQIDASSASLSPANAASLLGVGVEVEVEGDIVNSILIADELEIRKGESRLKSFVFDIDLPNNRFEVHYPPLPGTIVVNTDGQTTFKDDGPLEIKNFSLDQLVIGDYVEVEGIERSGDITANLVKRKNTGNSKLQGAVDAFDNIGFAWITILGISYNIVPTPGGTDFNGSDAATFFGQLIVGDLLEIKDNEVADGIADKVEKE
jgi:hypothetical protein